MIGQAPIENFKHLSNFKTVKDMNNNIESFLSIHKKDFTKSELILFKALLRFSCKVVGVSNISIKALLKAVSERHGAISESTFQRMKRKAIKLNILEVRSTARKNGSQSSNLWIFKRFINNKIVSFSTTNDIPTQSEKPLQQQQDDKGMTSHKTTNLFKTSKQKDINKRYNKRYVPTKFFDLASCYFHNQSTISELWKIIQISNYHTKHERHIMLDLACESLRDLIAHIKQNTVKKSIFALFYGIVQNKLDELYFSDLYDLDFAL